MEQLRSPKGATHRKRIVGRGVGSNRGGTSGKGSKGQNARAGGGVRPGFEGGQMPLFRRIARRGFSNYRSKKHFQVVNVGDVSSHFESGATVDEKALVEKRLIKGNGLPTKLLGMGTVDKKLEVKLDHLSQSAREKIEKAGGSVRAAAGLDQSPAKAEAPATRQKRPAKPAPQADAAVEPETDTSSEE